MATQGVVLTLLMCMVQFMYIATLANFWILIISALPLYTETMVLLDVATLHS